MNFSQDIFLSHNEFGGMEKELKRLHELVVLGGSDPHVGVDDRSLAHCLTADVLLSVLVPEGAVDL